MSAARDWPERNEFESSVVWCRTWGGLVSDDRGNYNHWWLWTEFDEPVGVTGWISAYYIDGQGNDQADGIPDCP